MSGKIVEHFTGQANIAYSRALFSALDNKMLPGNFDYPIVFNAAAIWRINAKYEVSNRYEYSTGRPYTPFDLATSIQQDRPIYDLSRINSIRGPVYSRFDFQVDRNFMVKNKTLTIYAGLENAFNRNNFLSYAWLPHCNGPGYCGMPNGPYTELYQMTRFPNFGMRYTF